MKQRVTIVVCVLSALAVSIAVRPPTGAVAQETLGSIEGLDPAFDRLVAPGTKIEWDSENLKVKNAPELNSFVQLEYRKGWALA